MIAINQSSEKCQTYTFSGGKVSTSFTLPDETVEICNNDHVKMIAPDGKTIIYVQGINLLDAINKGYAKVYGSKIIKDYEWSLNH